MDGAEVERVARLLDDARLQSRALDAAAVEVGSISSAYAIQRALTERRLARGDHVVGWKLGYTTAIMREQMGIASPNYGPLLASMRIEDAVLPTRLRSPRVEPEIAFVLRESPRGGSSADDVLGCVARAVLALEVVDSVWDGYRFDLEHNTADGSSAAGFVLGDELPLDIADVRVAMVRSGWPHGATDVTTGEGAMRAAAEATAWLVDRLGDQGLALHAGDVVLTGGLTAATSIGPEVGTRIRAEVALPQGRVAAVEVSTGVEGTPHVAV